MTIENNAPLLRPYYPPGGEMRSWGKYEPRTSPDPGEQFKTPRKTSGAPGHDPGEGLRSPFSGAQNPILERGDPQAEPPRSPMEKPRLQAHRSLRSHLQRKASKSGLPHRCRPTQYLVVPRARSGTPHHKILVPRQGRENPPAGRAHSRPRIYLRPPLSRAMPGTSSMSVDPECRKRKKNTKGR
ncbi:hypothetical protein ES703_111433 [subsurface metagenome]